MRSSRKSSLSNSAVGLGGKRIALQTVERLSTYRRVLEDLHSGGVQHVYSHQLAEYVDVTPAQLRRDLASFGSFGNISRGYNVQRLITTLAGLLGTANAQPVALIGVGNLGRTLLSYRGFIERGFVIEHAFDVDALKIGRVIAGRRCHDIESIEWVLREKPVNIAILACRQQGLQKVVDRLIAANVKAFLCFVPTLISVPPGVHLEMADMSAKLEKLSFLVNSSAVAPLIKGE